jgi:hypothetical protein
MVLRHRRAMRRHVEALCRDGLVERLDLGDRLTSVLRLTKYNPDYVHHPMLGEATPEPSFSQEVQRIKGR